MLAGNAREPHELAPPVVSEEQVRAELGSLFEIVQHREFRFSQAEADGTRFLGWSCLMRLPLRPIIRNLPNMRRSSRASRH